MSSKKQKDGECEEDAVPFGKPYTTTTGQTSGSSKNDEPSLSFEKGSGTGSPYSLVINHLTGQANIGNSYQIVSSGNNVTLQGTYVNVGSIDTDDDSDSDLERKEETINEDILNSSLGLSIDHKYLVAEEIGDTYLRLARYLPGAGFTTAEIQNIIHESIALGRVEGIYRILERWGEKAPTNATVGNLAKALQRVSRIDIANQLSLEG